MNKVIIVANQKGGVGKTTTVINLASYLAHLSYETLIIDLDPQANATSGLGINKAEVKKSIYNVLIDEVPIEEVILPTNIDWLQILPSNLDLIGAEVELVSMFSRENRLKNAMEKLKNIYHYIIIDSPPSLGLLTINGLVAANSLIIPIQCEYYSLEGLSQLLKLVDAIKKSLNPELFIEGVLLTMFDSRVNLSQQVFEETKKYFGDKVYKTVIPRNVRLAEAPSFGKPILLYDKNSKGAHSYLDLAKEFVEKETK